MTATIRKPDPNGPRHTERVRRKKRPARFSSMESLGFIETPTTISTWSTPPLPPRPPAPPPIPQQGDPLNGWHPSDVQTGLVTRRVRWGMVSTLVVVVAALAFAGVWLWHRPAAMADLAASDVSTAARALEPELEGLRELNETIAGAEIDPSAVTAQSFAVDARARALFNISGELAGPTRTLAADTATAALDASRLISDAVAYRSAVVQILLAPDLETDPDLVALDDAVRDFGQWQQRFNDIRSALPTGTMSAVSDELAAIAVNLDSIQGRYVDGVSNDDRLAASRALDDLTALLDGAESTLNNSLREIQTRVDELIESSLAGIDQLVG